jgi:hypothetical protein
MAQFHGKVSGPNLVTHLKQRPNIMSGVLWYILELGMDTKIACVHSYIQNLKEPGLHAQNLLTFLGSRSNN